jgi:hypothetical protein
MAIPTSGPQNGLCGYYIIPEIGAYRADVVWSSIEAHLAPIDSSVPNVVKRPSEDQYLIPLSAMDCRRLGIDLRVAAAQTPSNEDAVVNPLSSIKR